MLRVTSWENMVSWSDLALLAWGKTASSIDDEPILVPLPRHLEDSAAIAGVVWDQFLPTSVRRQISRQLPNGVQDGRALFTFLAAVHDVGKATPGFAVKLRFGKNFRDIATGILDDMEHAGLGCGDLRNSADALAPHCRMGQVALQDWLRRTYQYSPREQSRLGGIVGSHHGVPPTSLDLQGGVPDHHLGAGNWTAVRDEILARFAEKTKVAGLLKSRSATKLDMPAQVLLCGAVVIADWLASDTFRFPADDRRSSAERAASGFNDRDLPAPWAAKIDPGISAQSMFESRFTDNEIRPVQAAAIKAAHAATRPPIIVIEAGTGEGKTEGALLAAEVLAEKFGCGGIVFALPSQATANGVFPRIKGWVERLPGVGRTSMILAHGNAELSDDFQGIVQKGRLGAIFDDESTGSSVAVATSWLRGRRKGLLANFAVCTIDQVLLGGLRARHLPLRQLALAGKVVIIDEAHAADAYMRTYGRAIMQWLGAMGTPVIVLSATLPPQVRDEWVAAYAEGSFPDISDNEPAASIDTAAPGYAVDLTPRVTVLDSEVRDVKVAQGGHVQRSIEISLAGFDASAADDTICEAVGAGGVVAVIANTVDRAQRTYNRLVARLSPGQVELFHSRFLANHRAAREDSLRRRLGPPGEGDRPRGLVVVATQVIEQSLDVDFDLMVTDIAPIDLVVQRLGRLHRHQRGPEERDRPSSLRRPRALVLGVQWTATAPIIDSSVSAVYFDRDLLDALDVLSPHFSGTPLITPKDVPGLVRRAYDRARDLPDSWGDEPARTLREMTREVEDQRGRARVFCAHWPARIEAMTEYLEDGRTSDSDEHAAAQVRDSTDSLEVIVVRRVDGAVLPMPGCGLDDSPLPTEYDTPDDSVAKVLASCRLRLPRLRSGAQAGPAIDQAISELERRNSDLSGWQRSPWLKGALVLDLDEDLRTEIVGRGYHYDLDRGLVRDPKE